MSSMYWHAKDQALLKIPNLAIHLTDKSGTFEPNKELHLKPIISSSVIEQLCSVSKNESKPGVHFDQLLQRISKDLKLQEDSIVDFELNIIDS